MWCQHRKIFGVLASEVLSSRFGFETWACK
jgi:hypothetical protein